MKRILITIFTFAPLFSQTYFLQENESSFGLSIGTELAKDISFNQELSITVYNLVDLTFTYVQGMNEERSEDVPESENVSSSSKLFSVGATMLDKVYIAYSNNENYNIVSLSALYHFTNNSLMSLGFDRKSESKNDPRYQLKLSFLFDIKESLLANISVNHQLANTQEASQILLGLKFAYFFRF